MAALIALLASSTADSSGTGALLIAGVIVLIVVAVAGVWILAARRGSRMPGRAKHPHDPGVRGG
jgi:hypothetical protein